MPDVLLGRRQGHGHRDHYPIAQDFENVFRSTRFAVGFGHLGRVWGGRFPDSSRPRLFDGAEPRWALARGIGRLCSDQTALMAAPSSF